MVVVEMVEGGENGSEGDKRYDGNMVQQRNKAFCDFVFSVVLLTFCQQYCIFPALSNGGFLLINSSIFFST